MVSDSVTITIPMQPPREVSPNFHGSWRRKSRAVAEYRAQCGWAAKTVPETSSFSDDRPVVMDFEIRWSGQRKRLDDDNAKACMKAVIDGVADVLWFGQDRHVTIGSVSQVRGNGEVVVTIRRAGDS